MALLVYRTRCVLRLRNISSYFCLRRTILSILAGSFWLCAYTRQPPPLNPIDGGLMYFKGRLEMTTVYTNMCYYPDVHSVYIFYIVLGFQIEVFCRNNAFRPTTLLGDYVGCCMRRRCSSSIVVSSHLIVYSRLDVRISDSAFDEIFI